MSLLAILIFNILGIISHDGESNTDCSFTATTDVPPTDTATLLTATDIKKPSQQQYAPQPDDNTTLQDLTHITVEKLWRKASKDFMASLSTHLPNIKYLFLKGGCKPAEVKKCGGKVYNNNFTPFVNAH